jgi:hypothetical protein
VRADKHLRVRVRETELQQAMTEAEKETFWSINPVTGTNGEGVGVEPDIKGAR